MGRKRGEKIKNEQQQGSQKKDRNRRWLRGTEKAETYMERNKRRENLEKNG